MPHRIAPTPPGSTSRHVVHHGRAASSRIAAHIDASRCAIHARDRAHPMRFRLTVCLQMHHE
jgi:hypothetical protein